MRKLPFIVLFLLSSSFIFSQVNDTMTTASGLKYFFTHRGDGPTVDSGTVVVQHYTVWVSGGDTVDGSRRRNEPFIFEHPSTGLIKGTNEAIALMKVGDRGIFIMPHHLAYGEKGRGPVPPKATLVFDLEIIRTMKSSVRAELLKVLYDKSFSTDSIPKIKETLAKYKELKQTGFEGIYSRGLDDLNFIGNSLLNKFPAEAAKVFKLNTEEYPAIGRTFSLYSDALLKMGDSINAIINYKKSVEINPGDEKALKALKEMGVNTENLVKEFIVEEEVLQSYVGRYQLTPEMIITVSREGKQLKIQATGQGSAEIYPKTENIFYLKIVEAFFTFNLNETGQVESLTLFQDGETIKGKKIED